MRFWCLLSLVFLVVPAQAAQTVGATWYGNELRGHRTASGEMFFTTEYVYRSKMYGGPDNIPDATVDSWDQVAFRLGYRSDSDWWGTFWVENAFDEEYFERGWENADADNQYGYGLFNELVWPARPRSFGVTIGKNWK